MLVIHFVCCYGPGKTDKTVYRNQSVLRNTLSFPVTHSGMRFRYCFSRCITLLWDFKQANIGALFSLLLNGLHHL